MRTVLTVVAAAAVLASASFEARAQPTPVAVQFQVNSYENGNQARPSVCMMPQGDFVVGFLDHYPFVSGGQAGQDGSGSTACLIRFSAPAEQGFEFIASTYSTGDQTDIAAACAPNGDFLMGWADRPNADGAGRTAFAARVFDDLSLPKANAFDIRGSELVGAPLHRTAVCRGAGNDFVTTWVDGDGSLLGRRYDVNGNAVGTEFPIATGSPAAPACCGGNAGFIVAWGDDTLGDVSARRFSASAEPLDDAFVVNTETSAAQEAPDVACNDDGKLVVVWDSNAGDDTASSQDGDDHGIFGQAFDADGAAVGTEFRANSYTTGEQVDGRVSMDSTGRFVAVWTSAQLSEGRHGIFGRTFGADATTVGSEFRVDGSGPNPQSSESGHADVAMTPAGDFVVVWENDEDEGNGQGIFGRLYDFSSVTTSTTVPGALVCGDPVGASIGASSNVTDTFVSSDEVTASDALFVLQTAVGSQSCDVCVCDVDGSGTVVASDALLTLQKAVGQEVTLSCPPC